MDDDLKKLIETTAAETRRHFDIVAERLEAKVDRLDVRLERVEAKVVALDGKVDRLDAKLDRFAADVANEFNEVRSMIKFSHHELDRRLRMLEEIVSDLQTRVERLEGSTN